MDWDRTMITLKLKRLINYHPPQKNQNNPTYKLIQTRTKIISIKGKMDPSIKTWTLINKTQGSENRYLVTTFYVINCS